MRQVVKILALALLLSVVACERKTLGDAGTSKTKVAGAPDYTVQPTLNPPVKTN